MIDEKAEMSLIDDSGIFGDDFLRTVVDAIKVEDDAWAAVGEVKVDKDKVGARFAGFTR